MFRCRLLTAGQLERGPHTPTGVVIAQQAVRNDCLPIGPIAFGPTRISTLVHRLSCNSHRLRVGNTALLLRDDNPPIARFALFLFRQALRPLPNMASSSTPATPLL